MEPNYKILIVKSNEDGGEYLFASRGIKTHCKIDPTRRDLRGGEVGRESREMS
jgi:hypothetical protein